MSTQPSLPSSSSSSRSSTWSQGSSSGSLTLTHTPRTAAKSTPELNKIEQTNISTSQKGLFENEVGKLTAPATTEELRILQDIRTEATRKYAEWKTTTGTDEHKQAKEALDKAWTEILSDPKKKKLIDRYRQANEGETASFKSNKGLVGSTFDTFLRRWRDLAVEAEHNPRAPRVGDLQPDNPNFPRILDKVNQSILRDWRPILMKPSKRDHWSKKRASYSTPKTSPEATSMQ